MLKKIRNFLTCHPIIILFCLSLLTRILWVWIGMRSITDDETDIYISSYILARTGKDFYGNPFFLTSGILTPKPFVPILIGTIPWLFTSIKSVFLARLPFIILNSLTPVLFYALLKNTSKDRRFAFVAFLIFNFSPWFSYVPVTGYEATVGLFFVLAFFLVLSTHMKGWKKIGISTIIGFFAFNSYMGIKPIFPFICFIGGLLYFSSEHIKGTLRRYVILGLLSLMFFFANIGLNYVAPNATLIKNEYAYMAQYAEKPKMEGMVWFERYTTTGPKPLTVLIANKYSIRIRDYVSKYLLSFNPQIFFQKGDPSSLYGTADLSGLFFLTDFMFFIIGILCFSKLKQKGIYILTSLIFIGGISVAISTGSVTFILRGIILIIPYTLLIAHGVMIFFGQVKHKKIAYAAYILITLVNILLFCAVFNMRIMNLNGEQWRYSFQKIGTKISSAKNLYKKIVVFNPQKREFFFQYAFYCIHDPYAIVDRMSKENYTFGNVYTEKECPLGYPKIDELFVVNQEFCPIDEHDKNIRIKDVIKSRDMSGNDYYLYTGVNQSKTK